MRGKLFNSPVQHLLILIYRLVSPYLNLHRGLFGKAYQHIYFLYKNIVDRCLVTAAWKLAKPGTLVVDVGANIGFFCCKLCNKAGVRAIAFEPEKHNYSQLASHIQASHLQERIFPYQLALSDTTGTGKLYLSDLAPTDHKLINTRSTQALEISTMRLDDFLQLHPEHGQQRISLIKIDVQGAELLVLRGMHETLIKHGYPPIFVEYSPSDLLSANVTPQDFFQAFHRLGYRPHLLPDLKHRKPAWIIENTKAYVNLIMLVERGLTDSIGPCLDSY